MKNCYAEEVLKNVLKACLEDFLETFLEDVLKVCLDDVLKACLEGVLKTCLEDALKTCLENVFKTSSGQKKWGYLYLTNLNVCVSNKSIFHKSVSDDLKFKQHFYFEN